MKKKMTLSELSLTSFTTINPGHAVVGGSCDCSLDTFGAYCERACSNICVTDICTNNCQSAAC